MNSAHSIRALAAATWALVVEEWAIARWGLAAELERHGVASVECVSTATAADSMLRESAHAPGLAVVGAVSDQSVVRLTNRLVVDHGCPVIALLPARDMPRALTVLQAGASTVLDRDALRVDLHEPIRAALEGRRHLAEDTLDALIGGPVARRDRPVVALTPREYDVLRGLVAGRTNAAIAARLAISEETVKSHVSRLFQKLGVHRRTEAVGLALRLSLV